jgi:gliding motility-associated-like protein
VSAGGTYTVTASTACGMDSETITITQQSPPVAQINPAGPITFCAGDSVLLVGSGGDTYAWSTGETSSSIYISTGGIYTLTAINGCGSSQATLTATLQPLPEVNIITQGPVNLCQGSQVTITATSNETILWSNGMSGPSVTVSSGGTLTASATNACGTATSTIVINETPLPQINIVQNSPLVSCAGTPVILDAVSNVPVQWSHGPTSASISVNQSGTYVVTASNACGTASDSVHVIISGPIASFTADPPTGNAPLSVLFTSTSTGATNLHWDVDGTTYSVSSLNHTFYQPGTYEVLLIASDDNGCSDTANIKIVVGDQFEVFVPNVFTPNGDGLNDIFKIMATGVKDFRCRIFNRWGNEIFVWEDVTKGWDGSSLFGGRAPSGAYVYILEINSLSGEMKTLHGWVTLLD